jgi:transcriptional regulator GlxA family with amidase domain
MATTRRPRHVSLLALPESTGTPIHGMYETLVLVDAVASAEAGSGARLFEVEIVGSKRGVFPSATGLPLEVHRAVDEVARTDMVVMASMLFENQEWVTGRHPEIVDWLRQMHQQGADLASACAGALLLAETGLLDGREATTHWAFADTFRRNFPEVRLRLEELLIIGGRKGELVMSGAASSWQDLVLTLIARHANPRAAQAIGTFLLYEWHARSQAPFLPFSPATDHGDSLILDLQQLLQSDPAMANPVEELSRRCRLPRSTFTRRFKRATGYSPMHYVQRVRVEEAKRLLEQTERSVEEICWAVGYGEPASFRRLFKRITHLTPGEYRRRFRIPEYARAG